jgi:hypothetical protein
MADLDTLLQISNWLLVSAPILQRAAGQTPEAHIHVGQGMLKMR